MVMPFDNQSKMPGLEWISEAFPEILSQRMASAKLYVISREDRRYAFDRTGIPETVRPSRATIYGIAEQMDADYVVLGSYDFDGNRFRAKAQLLDMKKLRLSQSYESSGPLTSLIDIETALAWDLLQQMPNPPTISREQFLQTSKPIRLDAFESYIRGLMDSDRQQKIRHFREAARLNPNYTLAMLQLGKTYYSGHEYELASLWLGRIPKTDPVAGEANFLIGMSEYYLGNYDKAYAAFNFLANRLPLTEVYNNLGVVEERRGRKNQAVEYFSKAVSLDPSAADYHFNLAVALFKNGDNAGAARQLREELQRKPNDAEAKSLLEMIGRGVTASSLSQGPSSVAVNGLVGVPPGAAAAAQAHIPPERIKRNYNEATYRQLELEIENLQEQRLAKSDPKSRAAYHVQHGTQLLAQNAMPEAEKEFREAIATDSNNPAAHAGMAQVLEQKGDASNARAEAQMAIRLQPNVEAYLVLARLDLKQNQVEAAADAVTRALKLDPSNSSAQALQQEVTAKQIASH